MFYRIEKIKEELNKIKKQELKTLLVIEEGMRNFFYVPKEYIAKKMRIDPRKLDYILVSLLEKKCIKIFKKKGYVGYQLTFFGYDLLGFDFLRKKKIISEIGDYIEMGKEADIVSATSPNNLALVVKIYHIGRTSFHNIWRHRLYFYQKKWFSWLHASYLVAKREFEITKELFDRGYPVSEPVTWNRNLIVFKYLKNTKELGRIKNLENPEKLFYEIIETYAKIVNEKQIVHGDFNVFNVLIDVDNHNKFYIIDWGQYLSIYDPGAKEILKKEIEEFIDFFIRKYRLNIDPNEILKRFEI